MFGLFKPSLRDRVSKDLYETQESLLNWRSQLEYATAMVALLETRADRLEAESKALHAPPPCPPAPPRDAYGAPKPAFVVTKTTTVKSKPRTKKAA